MVKTNKHTYKRLLKIKKKEKKKILKGKVIKVDVQMKNENECLLLLLSSVKSHTYNITVERGIERKKDRENKDERLLIMHLK